MKYTFAAVRFVEDDNLRDKSYWYVGDDGLNLSDAVLAPVGSHNRLQLGRVERVFKAEPQNAPYDIRMMKRIAAKYGARKITLPSGKRCREMGGVRYSNKRFTRYGVFLKAELPLAREDKFLLSDDFGVTCVVEVCEGDGAVWNALDKLSEKEGCALFGAADGAEESRDNADIVAMFLLNIAGADGQAVYADYLLSYPKGEKGKEDFEKLYAFVVRARETLTDGQKRTIEKLQQKLC